MRVRSACRLPARVSHLRSPSASPWRTVGSSRSLAVTPARVLVVGPGSRVETEARAVDVTAAGVEHEVRREQGYHQQAADVGKAAGPPGRRGRFCSEVTSSRLHMAPMPAASFDDSTALRACPERARPGRWIT